MLVKSKGRHYQRLKQPKNRMTFSLYRPSYVRLPEDCPLRRMIVRSEPVGKSGPPWPTSEETLHFDDRTLFYDIRYSHGSKRFHAIGPPLENLADPLKIIKAHVSQNGEEVARGVVFRPVEVSPNVVRYTSRQSVDIDPKPGITLRFNAEGVKLGETTIVGHRPNPGKVFATTLQKNSEPEWVCDWLDYLETLGVDGALIYDNGSENHSVLREALRSRNSKQTVQLIEWPFPYGPHRFPSLRYCQDGQIAHAAQWFWNGKWMLTLDIDCYPVLPSRTKISALVKSATPETGAFSFEGRNVHAVTGDNLGPDRRAPDFTATNNQALPDAHKHLVKLRAANTVTTHDLSLKDDFCTVKLPSETSYYAHILPLTSDKNELFDPKRLVPLAGVSDDFTENTSIQKAMKRKLRIWPRP